MKQCQKFHFLRCVIGLGRSYLHKDAHTHTQTRTWRVRERLICTYVAWMISCHVVVVVEKQVSAGQTLLQIKLWKESIMNHTLP